jgi:predicted anti-sigma-YlaC factor YlaD
MECERIQTAILATFDGDSPVVDPVVEAHLAECPACARFAAAQAAIDSRLAASVVTPPMSSDFRRLLRARIGQERVPAWREALPDIVHFASWGAATLLCVLVLPLNASVILGGGATAALLTYVVLTVARTSLEDAGL